MHLASTHPFIRRSVSRSTNRSRLSTERFTSSRIKTFDISRSQCLVTSESNPTSCDPKVLGVTSAHPCGYPSYKRFQTRGPFTGPDRSSSQSNSKLLRGPGNISHEMPPKPGNPPKISASAPRELSQKPFRPLNTQSASVTRRASTTPNPPSGRASPGHWSGRVPNSLAAANAVRRPRPLCLSFSCFQYPWTCFARKRESSLYTWIYIRHMVTSF